MALHPILQNFYASKQWRTFREALIMERMINGQVICEHCHKPILVAKDVTLHHKTELTVNNVHDSYISLNPDNILIVHNTCHNQIHDRFYNRHKQQVFLVYGPPLAGKTSYVRKYKAHNDLVVDMDNIYSALTGLERYDKPNALLSNAIAVRDVLIDNIKTRHGKWHNAWIVGGYADIYKRNMVIEATGAEPILLMPSIDECMARLEGDSFRKKNDWNKYIRQWFDVYTPHPLIID